MGEVYLAEDQKLSRQVALKVLPWHFNEDPDRMRRFQREAQAVSALNHPNILTIFEFDEQDSMHIIASEFVEGETLRQRLRRGSLTVSDCVDISIQTASALQAAHAAGVIHRDIKPENVMVRRDGIVKVLDFGLAKLTERSRPSNGNDTPIEFFSNPGMILGTAAYMSPEQAKAISIDHRTDIFSLGVVMYEMIAGKSPFVGESTAEVIAAMIQADPPHIRKLVPSVPDKLDEIIAKALAKDRNNRFGSATEMLAELKTVSPSSEMPLPVSSEHQETLPLIPAINTSSTRSYRRQLIAAGAFVLTVALAVAAIWTFAPDRKDQNPLASLRRSQLITWDGEAGEGDTQAKFSPNGTMIALSLTKNGQRNIWTKQVPDGKPNQTTDGKWDYYNPIWSADGQRIAFISNRDNRRAIWTVPFSGGDLTLIKEIESDTFSLLHWSKDGATIYYQEGVYQQGYNLFALDIASKRVTQLTNFDSSNRAQFIRLSPNEDRIVYSSGSDERLHIYVMNLGGGQPVQVTSDETSDEYPIWLPDGNRIIYSSKRNDIYQTCIAYVDEKRSEQLNLDLQDTLISDVSSDGSKLLFYQSREESDVWRIGMDDKVETRVTSDYGLEFWPDVSPDGKSMVFQSTREFKHLLEGTITVRSANDGQEVKVTSNGFSPSFSPNGEKLAFLRDSGDRITLWTVGRNGEDERQLTEDEVGFSGFSQTPFNRVQVKDYSWSPDGGRLIYCAKKEGLWNIWEIPVDGGKPRQVSNNTNPATTFSCPLFTPDGKRIAFTSGTGRTADAKKITSLMLVDGEKAEDAFSSESAFRLIGRKQLDGLVIAIPKDKPSAKPIKVKIALVSPGRSTVDIASIESAYFYNIRLSPDGERIAFVTRPEAGADGIRIISTSGGGNIRLTANTNPNEYISEIAWSPDSRTIYYGKQRQTRMISMIEHFK